MLEEANKLDAKIQILKQELKLITMAKVKSINVRIFNDANCEFQEHEIVNIPSRQLRGLMTDYLKKDIEHLETKLKNLFKNE